jgi:acetylornithine deacetylase/succinyl-diaminopimelate desuccinylase-like protein
MVVAHKGFVWLEVDIHSVAAHGSQPSLGIDAISKARYFLAELDKYARKLNSQPPQSILGSPSVHAFLIKGGEEPTSYPAKCTITLE